MVRETIRNPIFWLTGLPCSGKTTIARELAKRIGAEIIDGDDIRNLMQNTDFSPSGRAKHMLAVANLAWRFSKYTPVVVALVSPLKKVREEIKFKYLDVIEIFVYCDLEICKKRDVKGMYAKAELGEIKNFTGVDAPYEEPNTDRHTPGYTTFVDTEMQTVEECVDVILKREYKQKTYSLMIGRYQPLHAGHCKLIQKLLDEGKNVLVGLRNTGIDENNPHSVEERRDMLQAEFGNKIKVMEIADIEEVIYGRRVGWGIREIQLDKETEKISATEIREKKKDARRPRK
ncbi:MAG: adenylyl-sulfate kinase [bacterium]|nr:adenylyl-sulfate kinase [bacterium]